MASPSPITIRKNLTNLVRHGVDAWWVEAVGKDLLRLACVREKLPEGAEPDEEQLFEALRELLRDAIEKLGSEQSRIILRIVLSLEPGTLELSLRERREKAGLEFRRGRQTVTWGTIRSYHERRAIDQLAKMIFGMEQSASTPPLFDDGT